MVQQGDFEWDAAKAAANLRKHKVSFTEAATVFLDPNVLIEPDSLHSADELRATAIGLSALSRILLVVQHGTYSAYPAVQRPQIDAEESRKYYAHS